MIKFRIILLVLLSLITSSVFAWNRSVEFGYGFSHDPNHTKYNNSGALLSGDLYPIARNSWSFWSITGSLGEFFTNAPKDKNVTTLAASLALRLYPFAIKTYPAYIFGSAGPALLSSDKFGLNTQAGHLSIQTNIGAGMEFNHIDLNARLVHYSNAHLGTPNEGFNILYLVSLGYLF